MDELHTLNVGLSQFESGLILHVIGRKPNTWFEVDDHEDHGEARYQLVEGCFYDYEFSDSSYWIPKDSNNIIQPHPRNKHLGTISPNIYVGTLSLPLFKGDEEIGSIELEVRSIKSSYRQDYRDMLEFITEQCAGLLMQSSSPVAHSFETDFTKDPDTLYQRFAFLNSILGNDEFANAVHRVVSLPVTRWETIEGERDVRRLRRLNNANLKSLVKGSNRLPLPAGHPMESLGLTSVPSKIAYSQKTDSVDTPENRFIKHALETFLSFCVEISEASEENSRLEKESELLINKLEEFLQHTLFNHISNPTTLRLNSPVLQRKEGYREILRVWLMFDLAAKLVWKGGEDVYQAGKKDIAVLYEYWLFFALLDLLQSVFSIDAKEIDELISESKNGLNLQIKQGRHTALKGTYTSGVRDLNIRFNYNRPFSPTANKYPASGSWTIPMRPDYTLSIWPSGITESKAEEQELIVHIQFDAKYKIADLQGLFEDESQEALDAEKTENRKGVYKNADLLKMHAYKDAIRRTGGAYVLYPGDLPIERKGFHEIIPGLGAFPIKPSKTETGLSELRAFIFKVLEHFLNRASQRERMAFKTYDVHQDPPSTPLKESLPEALGENRSQLPDETYVLVGYYREGNLDWIKSAGLYNARANTDRGSLRLGPGEAGAKYLLLHTRNETTTGRLFKITEEGPRVFSKQTLIEKGYPTEPSQDFYLVYRVEECQEDEFANAFWDVTKLRAYKAGRGSALPFSVTLTELMGVKVTHG